MRIGILVVVLMLQCAAQVARPPFHTVMAQTADVTQGLQADWDLYSTNSGLTSVTDLSSHGNTLTLGTSTAAPTWGPYLTFVGSSNQFAQVASSSQLDFPMTDLTLLCIFKTSTASGRLISKRSGTAGYELYVNGSGLEWFYGDGTHFAQGTTTIPNIADNVWHIGILTVTHGGNARVFVDGIPTTAQVSVSTVGSTTNTSNTFIGKNFASYTGSMARVRIYNAALTDFQVTKVCAWLSQVYAAKGTAITVGQYNAGTLATRSRSLSSTCGAFFHWNMRTFASAAQRGATHSQWANPNLPIDTFAPTGLNIDQWLNTVVSAGCGYAILTVKHHDGFKLWPSASHVGGAVVYGIGSTTWYANNGSPDVVSQFVTKCRSRNLQPILYYSIWDRTYEVQSSTTASSGTSGYIAMIQAELTELLSNYGTIAAIWTDGWGWGAAPTTAGDEAGGVGGYTYIPFATINTTIKSLQPNCILIENVHNHPRYNTDLEVYEETVDSTISASNTRPSQTAGTITSDNLSWFYTPEYRHGSDQNRPPQELAILIRNNIAANSTLVFDFGPDQSGSLLANQIANANLIPNELQYRTNLALGKTVTVSSTASGGGAAAQLTDGIFCFGGPSVWVSDYTADSAPYAEVDLGSSQTIARVEMVNRATGVLNAGGFHNGDLRDLVVTIYDSSHTLIYTSATLNPANALEDGTYTNGPNVVYLALSPTQTGRYVRVTRNTLGSTQNADNWTLAMNELMVFGPAGN